ncbi:hypothetical protein ACIBQ1_15010 [Nonomuraea sp. NPDC050153]|uniref:hypothetical protein n=1 Tax=Nonomuraea sp. NPDC050153 TaxID=3364359 RepID=UPI0037A5306A
MDWPSDAVGWWSVEGRGDWPPAEDAEKWPPPDDVDGPSTRPGTGSAGSPGDGGSPAPDGSPPGGTGTPDPDAGRTGDSLGNVHRGWWVLLAIVVTAGLAGAAFWIAHKLGPRPDPPPDPTYAPLPDSSPDPPRGSSD